MTLELPGDLETLLRETPALRQAFVVGGCVRDALLGKPLKDFDIEVFGIGLEQLAEALRPAGRIDLVGKSFGVIKLSLRGAVHDFTIPRRDSKTGPGHRGFNIELDPSITPREAAARRDFTINAMMYDPRRRELLDFFGGEADLAQRILRHTSPAFVEDPLRVLRGMQFAARFRLLPAPETVSLCQAMSAEFNELAVERVREEWFKWAALSELPSAGLRFLEATRWLRHFPEIAAMQGVPQDPEWHPEGDVFTHTCHVVDALAGLEAWRAADPSTRVVLMLAALCHDFGKATTTLRVERDGRTRIMSPAHERESGRLAESFLQRIRAPHAIVERVLPLVLNHMASFEEATERAVRRLARRLAPENVDRLCVLMTADAMARPPRPPVAPESVKKIRRMAESMRIADAAPRPIVQGRHLLELGFAPGKDVGRWVRAAFEAQLEGEFSDLEGARAWLASKLASEKK